MQVIIIFVLIVNNYHTLYYARNIQRFGMKFFFYSLEHLPIHIHVRNADGTAKFKVNPVKLVESHGIKPKDLMLAEALVEQHSELIIKKWHEFHGE